MPAQRLLYSNVVHCAAKVNLIYPYAGLRSENVVATANVLQVGRASDDRLTVHGQLLTATCRAHSALSY